MDFLMILNWLLYQCRPHTKLEKKAFPMSNYRTKNLGIHYDWSTWSCAYIWTSDWDMGDGVILHGLAIQNVLQDLSKVSSTQKSSCYSVEGRTKGYWVGNQECPLETKGCETECYVQFSSVQSPSRVWLFAIPWTAACQASLSITNCWGLSKPMSIESVMPRNWNKYSESKTQKSEEAGDGEWQVCN